MATSLSLACTFRMKWMQRRFNCPPSEANLQTSPRFFFLFSAIYWLELKWPCSQFLFLLFWRITLKSVTVKRESTVLKDEVQPGHFLHRLFGENNVEVDWGLSCGGRQRPCLVGGRFLCSVLGMPFWPIFDLFMWTQNKGPHYGLFAVCVGVNNISLSKLLWLIHGKQTNNRSVSKDRTRFHLRGLHLRLLSLSSASDAGIGRAQLRVCVFIPVDMLPKQTALRDWSLCALYHLNPTWLCPPPAMFPRSHCGSTKAARNTSP